jgi:transposase InsO family protein
MSRRRRLTAGGTGGLRPERKRVRRWSVCLTVRAGRIARRGSSRPSSPKRSVTADARLAGGRRLVAGATGFAHSTVSKVLERAGISRPARAAREPANSYEWPCPGDLLHMDTSEYVRFQKPGHRVTGDRASQDRQQRVGIDFAHAIVDDHSRLAYAELHPDQRAATVAAFLERALAFYASHGIIAKRLMTDNAWIYVRSRAVRELLARDGIRHLTTKPYRPRTNGKVERFHQTMAREWAYGLVYRSHRERAAALPHWLDHYNRTRPHSSLGGRPPISRVHNLCGHDS